MRKRILYWCSAAFSLLVCVAGVAVKAEGVAPYIPINASSFLNNEIERLATVANIPNLSKPYNLANVLYHLHKVQYTHPELYQRLSKALLPYKTRFGVTQAIASGSYHNDSQDLLPNAQGLGINDNAQLSLQAQWQVQPWLGVYAGTQISEELEQYSGSMVSLGTSWAQLDVGYRDYWLSPFQGSAQVISTNGQTMPSISLSNNLPISFWNTAFNYQIFVAEMSEQPVRFEGRDTVGDGPLLSVVHINFQPTDWWTIGGSRAFQFGGGERPTDLNTLLRAFYDPRGADNDATEDEESGNQIAAISSSMNFDGKWPFTFNVEMAGEDTSNNKAVQLGNSALTAGIYVPYFFTPHLSITYEYSEWQNGWYTNNVYPQDGYANEGAVLGHWAMQVQRENGTATAGSAHYLKSIWQTPQDHLIALQLRTSEHQDRAPIDYKDAWSVDLEYAIPAGANTISAGIFAGRNSFGDDFWQARLRFYWNQ